MKRNQMIRLMEYPLTDAGNAARLHELFGKKWVYMPKFRKWMQWDGHCLQTVKAETLCLAAAEAFENLAAGICHLPATADPQEQVGSKRTEKTAYGGVKRNARRRGLSEMAGRVFLSACLLRRLYLKMVQVFFFSKVLFLYLHFVLQTGFLSGFLIYK